MKYFINDIGCTKEEFESQWNKALEDYEKEYALDNTNGANCLTKEKLQELLTKRRICVLCVPRSTKITFIQCEEEILEMKRIIEWNEYDPWDDDALPIAVALWNAGYRLVK